MVICRRGLFGIYLSSFFTKKLFSSENQNRLTDRKSDREKKTVAIERHKTHYFSKKGGKICKWLKFIYFQMKGFSCLFFRFIIYVKGRIFSEWSLMSSDKVLLKVSKRLEISVHFCFGKHNSFRNRNVTCPTIKRKCSWISSDLY